MFLLEVIMLVISSLVFTVSCKKAKISDVQFQKPEVGNVQSEGVGFGLTTLATIDPYLLRVRSLVNKNADDPQKVPYLSFVGNGADYYLVEACRFEQAEEGSDSRICLPLMKKGFREFYLPLPDSEIWSVKIYPCLDNEPDRSFRQKESVFCNQTEEIPSLDLSYTGNDTLIPLITHQFESSVDKLFSQGEPIRDLVLKASAYNQKICPDQFDSLLDQYRFITASDLGRALVRDVIDKDSSADNSALQLTGGASETLGREQRVLDRSLRTVSGTPIEDLESKWFNEDGAEGRGRYLTSMDAATDYNGFKSTTMESLKNRFPDAASTQYFERVATFDAKARLEQNFFKKKIEALKFQLDEDLKLYRLLNELDEGVVANNVETGKSVQISEPFHIQQARAEISKYEKMLVTSEKSHRQKMANIFETLNKISVNKLEVELTKELDTVNKKLAHLKDLEAKTLMYQYYDSMMKEVDSKTIELSSLNTELSNKTVAQGSLRGDVLKLDAEVYKMQKSGLINSPRYLELSDNLRILKNELNLVTGEIESIKFRMNEINIDLDRSSFERLYSVDFDNYEKLKAAGFDSDGTLKAVREQAGELGNIHKSLMDKKGLHVKFSGPLADPAVLKKSHGDLISETQRIKSMPELDLKITKALLLTEAGVDECVRLKEDLIRTFELVQSLKETISNKLDLYTDLTGIN